MRLTSVAFLLSVVYKVKVLIFLYYFAVCFFFPLWSAGLTIDILRHVKEGSNNEKFSSQ